MSTTQKDRLRALLEPVVTAAGADLEDLSVSPAGKRRVLRVVVDADEGVDLDAVARVSRAVSESLDASDVMGASPYLLEVTTPGVDRPLTAERHWRRSAGRLVKVVLGDGGTVVGRIGPADAEGVDLDVEGSPRRIGYDEVRKAVIQVEFNRPAGPGETPVADTGDDADAEDTADTVDSADAEETADTEDSN